MLKKPFFLVVNKWQVLALIGALALVSGVLSVGRGVVSTLAPIRDAVSGCKVAIDPGHGGIDGGAVGKNGLIEKEVNLDISQELKLLLNRNAIYTVMTRETDRDLIEPNEDITGSRKREELSRRAKLVSESGADLFVSIHANSFSKSQWSGAQVFYREGSEEGKRLAETIQAELVSQLGPNSRKAKTADLYMLNNVDIPAVLIEVGFLSNSREEQLLSDHAYRQKVAQAISQGITNYLMDTYNANLNGSNSNVQSTSSLTGGGNGMVVKVTSDSVADVKMVKDPSVTTAEDEALLYLGGPSNFEDYLMPERRSIPGLSKMANSEKVRAILAELIKGPGTDSIFNSTIPSGTLVRDVKIDGDVVSVSFSEELVRNHWGGSIGEEMTIYSIVNTLTELPFVKKVKILVDGEELDTISGHVEIGGALSRRVY